MMVAIKAPTRQALNAVIKKYNLHLTSGTIEWWFSWCNVKDNYLCVSVDFKGVQQGGGHSCSLHDLGSIKILNGEEGRRQL